MLTGGYLASCLQSQPAWHSKTRCEYVLVGSTAPSLPPTVLGRHAGRRMSWKGGLNSYAYRLIWGVYAAPD
jgi:hypothetical protein